MNDVVREWVDKAEEDWQVVCLLQQSEAKVYNTICFHAQQCAEKLFKALLIEHKTVPDYTHDLVRLYRKLTAFYGEWNISIDELAMLSAASVEFRYPGEDASPENAEECIEICDRIRQQVLAILQTND
jgi:HEPN domain-containing protein